jgi:hypothetical protein
MLSDKLIFQIIIISYLLIFKQLLRSQLNESRVKNELLEQALRVIAQENLDLELKKIRDGKQTSSGGANGSGVINPTDGGLSHQNNHGRSSSRTVSPSPQSNKTSTEDDALDELESGSEFDEFFDIGNLNISI